MTLPPEIINSDIHIFRFNWRPGQLYNCNNIVALPVEGEYFTFTLYKCVRSHTSSDTMDASMWQMYKG